MDNCPLVKVELQTDVFMVCLQHALSTENFEVMGLLIGNVSNIKSNQFLNEYPSLPFYIATLLILDRIRNFKNFCCYYIETF